MADFDLQEGHAVRAHIVEAHYGYIKINSCEKT